jgi:hypothetical protein
VTEALGAPFGTFVTPSVSASGKISTLHSPTTHYARDTLCVLPLRTRRTSRCQ